MSRKEILLSTEVQYDYHTLVSTLRSEGSYTEIILLYIDIYVCVCYIRLTLQSYIIHIILLCNDKQ